MCIAPKNTSEPLFYLGKQQSKSLQHRSLHVPVEAISKNTDEWTCNVDHWRLERFGTRQPYHLTQTLCSLFLYLRKPIKNGLTEDRKNWCDAL